VATARSVTEAEQVVRGLLDQGGRAVSIQAERQSGRGCPALGANHREDLRALDILVNNAGTTGPTSTSRWWTCPRSFGDFMIGNHLRSTFLCIKYAAPQ